MNRRAHRSALLLLSAVALGCSPSGPVAPSSGMPSSSAPVADPRAFADMLTYKGDMARTGRMPGPGPMDPPAELWRVELEDGVAVTPLVYEGRVVVIDMGGTIRALDGVSGRETWSIQLPFGVETTPTIADGTLYAITLDGVLRTVSLADQVTGWTADGFHDTSIVTISGDMVLAGRPGEIVALATGDGHELWRSETGGSDRAAIDGDVAYVGGDGSGRLTAVSLEDGAEEWRLDIGVARVLTPVVDDGGLVIAGRDIPGGQNVVLGLDRAADAQWRWEPPGRDRIGAHLVTDDRVIVSLGSPAGGVYGLDRDAGTEAWGQAVAGEMVMIPIVAGQTVYVAADRGGLTALDAMTGTIRWNHALGPILDGGLAVSGGLLFVTTRDVGGGGQVIALADPTDPRVAAASTAAPTGPGPPVTPLPGVPVRVLGETPIEGQSLLLSVAAAADGTMYATDSYYSRILVRHPDGAIETWGEPGAGPGQFDFGEVTQNDTSTSVAVSADGGLLAVGDGANHRVQLFDGSRNWLRSIGRLGREEGQFVNPCCVAIDAEHRIWVVDTAQAEVQVFDEDGTFQLAFGSLGSGEGQLDRPGIPFVDSAAGEVLIPDFANRRVSVFSTDGTWLRHYDRGTNPELAFDELNAVTIDPAGRIWTVDTTNRLFVFERDGTLVAKLRAVFGEAGPIEASPFAIDADGRIYIADLGGATAGRLIIGQLEPPLWPAE